MRPSHSFIVLALSLLLRLVTGVPQATAPSALLATTEPAPGSSTGAPASCGGCYIVADVAGVVWYSGVFANNAATAVVAIGLGNGTRTTRTSIVENTAVFTFNPGLGGSAAFGPTPLAVTSIGYDSTTVIGGATLTSPTAYNIFSAYTLTSQQDVNGVCSTTSYTSTLPVAFTETLSSANGQVTLDLAGEQAFIQNIGFTQCAGGGENVGGTVLAQVANLTSTTTSYFSSVALGTMSTTLAPTTNPTSKLPLRTTTLSEVLTTLTATLSGSLTITSAPTSISVTAPAIVIGNTTITPSGNPLGLTLAPDNSTAFPAPSGTGASGTGVVVGGGGNYTVPFISNAPGWERSISIWGSALLVFLMAVGLILYGATSNGNEILHEHISYGTLDLNLHEVSRSPFSDLYPSIRIEL
ncbi:MAG: hypothetical protein Q9170_006193 [Blastenia crenularia]